MISSAAAIRIRLQGPEQDHAISTEINELCAYLTTLLYMDDVYELAMNFNLNTIQTNINNFLSSDIFLKFVAKWQAKPGIKYVDAQLEADKLPRGEIYIQIKKDSANMPLSFCIGYKPSGWLGNGVRCSVDFSDQDLVEKCKIIRDNNLTYVKKSFVVALQEEISGIFTLLESAKNKDRIKIISRFNEKWQDKLEMELTYNIDSGGGTLNVKDKFGLLSFKHFSNHFQEDKTQLIEVNQTQSVITANSEMIPEDATKMKLM